MKSTIFGFMIYLLSLYRFKTADVETKRYYKTNFQFKF